MSGPLDEGELIKLLVKSSEVFENEPQLIDIQGECVIVGDVHGDIESVVKALRLLEQNRTLVFLGDYVDRGPYQLESISTLLKAKMENPSRLMLLRGNHESRSMNLYYGFYNVVLSRYSQAVYELFVDVFSKMPVCTLINGKVLCIHGGIAEGLESINQLRMLPKGDDDPTDPIYVQVLWNDPDESVDTFAPSYRGSNIKLFGAPPLENFLKKNGLKMIVRAHEPQPEGFKFMFGNKLLSLFSCRYYGIRPAAALLNKNEIKILSLE
ncbi:MAG: serine/threonine protein phosphatase [Nitrososphaerota archaeon]|nr:serine/threonine protein phosphatase [Aigarchaeota archaeon]MDW8076416.1 serine/threonine protein phosphatase [Nitrososphaerota archaeon]